MRHREQCDPRGSVARRYLTIMKQDWSARAVAVIRAMLSKVLAEAVVIVEEEWQEEAMGRGALQ